MNYYLTTADKWYIYRDGRWQFVATEVIGAGVRLEVVISSGSDILEVCRLGHGESELLRGLDPLQLEPNQRWAMYRETGKEKKNGAQEGQGQKVQEG